MGEETEGTNAAHGEAGVPYVDNAKNKATYDAWQETYAAWKEANSDLAKELEDAIADKVMPAEDMIKGIDAMGGDAEATRVSGYKVIQEIAKLVPNYISGSADLHGSTRNYIDGAGNFGAGFDKTYAGKNLYFGIREHAMGAILNGIAYHGIFKASGSTFT